jgi:hypothetical protein
VILAKATIEGTGGFLGYEVFTACDLQAGASNDHNYVGAGGVSSQIVHRFTKPGRVEFRCFGFNNEGVLRQIKVTAFQVDKLTRKATEF